MFCRPIVGHLPLASARSTALSYATKDSLALHQIMGSALCSYFKLNFDAKKKDNPLNAFFPSCTAKEKK